LPSSCAEMYRLYLFPRSALWPRGFLHFPPRPFLPAAGVFNLRVDNTARPTVAKNQKAKRRVGTRSTEIHVGCRENLAGGTLFFSFFFCTYFVEAILVCLLLGLRATTRDHWPTKPRISTPRVWWKEKCPEISKKRLYYIS